jgi:hypothetical protein
MEPISIPAHFDGEKILLDKPYELKPDAKLIVTVLPNHDSEHEAWVHLSADRLNRAYGENEAEYSLELIKDRNPEYEGRPL